jgi:hypothetical protein
VIGKCLHLKKVAKGVTLENSKRTILKSLNTMGCNIVVNHISVAKMDVKWL